MGRHLARWTGRTGPPRSQPEVKGPRKGEARNTGAAGACVAELSSGNTAPLPAQQSSGGGSLTTISQVGFGETVSPLGTEACRTQTQPPGVRSPCAQPSGSVFQRCGLNE